MGKRFLSLCLVLLLALAGCSGAADPAGPADPPPVQESAPPPETIPWEENYSGIFSLLGTEPVRAGETEAEAEFEYNELLNQNVRRVDLANGGRLEVNEEGEIVQVDNFKVADPSQSLSTLEDAAAILESELGLDGYVLTKNELFAGDNYRLVWEKQVGEYLNPHDGVHVLLDAETTQLVDLKFFRFVAASGEPVLTQEEAQKIAEPYLEDRDSEARISCVRPQVDITGGNPRQKTTANLAYIFTNEVVSVSVDARTGEVIGLAYAAGGDGRQFVTPLADPDGKDLGETVTFSMDLPDAWSVADNVIYTDDGKRMLAEILPSVPFASTGVYDELAKQYPGSDPIDVTVGGLTGKYFFYQTQVKDPPFEGVFQNEIFYYLERGDKLICIKFYPGYGVGVGTQMKEFQEAIRAIR